MAGFFWFFTELRETVGAGLPAMDSSTPRLSGSHALSTIAAPQLLQGSVPTFFWFFPGLREEPKKMLPPPTMSVTTSGALCFVLCALCIAASGGDPQAIVRMASGAGSFYRSFKWIGS